LAVSVAVLGVLCLSACQAVLTPNGPPYTASWNASTSTLTVTNTSSGNNERTGIGSSKEPNESASTYCATWDSGTTPTQNGIVFRGVTDTGGWDAVELERSYYGATTNDGYWVVVYFHGGTFTVDNASATNLAAYTQGTGWPLQVCAAITANDVLSFAVAKVGTPVPALGTPGQGGTFTLNPADVPASGRTGSYFAHLPVGTSATVSNIVIDGVPSANPLS